MKFNMYNFLLKWHKICTNCSQNLLFWKTKTITFKALPSNKWLRHHRCQHTNCWETIYNTVRQHLNLSDFIYQSQCRQGFFQTALYCNVFALICFSSLFFFSIHTYTSVKLSKTVHHRHTNINIHTHTYTLLSIYSLICPLVNKPHMLTTDCHWLQNAGQTNSLASWAAPSPASWLV